jgi:pimeloyl-ACP methyl ester carboxylesterase
VARAAGAMVAFVCALVVFLFPAVAAADTVTLGPPLPTGTHYSGGNCVQPDCAYFTNASTAFPFVAPGAGTITSWSVEDFTGTAQLIVVQQGSGGTYAIVAEGALETEPCAQAPTNCLPPPNTVYTFATDLPIAAGQFVGMRAIQPANCQNDMPSDCTQIGFVPFGDPENAGGNVEAFDPTPALNTPTVPYSVNVPPYTLNAVEQLSSGVTVASGNAVLEPASGSVPATFTVSLPDAQSSDATVDYHTVEGTATAAANEYTPVPSGSVTIPAGQTSAQLQVQVDNGSGAASTGTLGFQVQLSGLSGGDAGLALDPNGSVAPGTITVPGITGTVVDQKGKPLVGATVALTGTAASGQSVSRQAHTDASGAYAIYADPGGYAITATAPNASPGDLYASQCPSGTAIAHGCQLQLTPGARDAINFNQGPITITAIKLQQLNVASDQVETVPSTGTIDGNRVDVIATLRNNTPAAQSTDVGFGSPIDNSATTAITQSGVTVPAGGSLDVDEQLDTNGLAWSDAGAPDSQRTIKITLADGTSNEAMLTVRPKPVILVHGLWSSAATWDSYIGGGGFLAGKNILWRGYAVGDGQAPGLMNTSPFQSPANTIAQNAFQQAIYIRGVRDSTDAQHVDIVAHSMGGLISRYYLQELMPGPPPGDPRPVVSHLVMMGTPNEGSNCAYDALSAEALFGLTGGSAINQPLLQLTPAYVASFNQQITNTRGVPFSILAGTGFHNVAACTNFGGGIGPGLPNDGVVTKPSAWWTISDRTTEPLIHTSETGSETAFTDWVTPHLAVGPNAAGGGTYTGPLVAGSARLGATPHTAARANANPSIRARAATSRKPKLCLTAAPVPSLSAGETATVRAAHTVSMPIRVPPHAGTLTAVLLAQPAVTTRLLDPRGHLTQTIAAGSTAADGLFRTLSASAPRAGTWHLDASAAAHSGTSPVSIAVQFTRPPLHVKLSILQVGSKRKHAPRGPALRFTARVSATRSPAISARVIVELLMPAQHPVVLHLRAVHGHNGRYAAESAPLKNPTPAAVLVHARTSVGSVTSTFQLQAGCTQST